MVHIMHVCFYKLPEDYSMLHMEVSWPHKKHIQQSVNLCKQCHEIVGFKPTLLKISI